LLGPAGIQALAGSAAPRQLLDARTRRALTHGSLTRQRLERVVAKLHGCLGQLAPMQRRVLVLLAGVGSRPALGRAQVARRLGLGIAQTGRIERHAVWRLGALDAAGRCVAGGGGGTPSFAALLTLGPAGLDSGLTPAAGDGAALGRSRGAVKGVSESGGSQGGGAALGAALPPPLGRGSAWTLVLMLMVAALVVLLVRRELRRQRGH
jgi:hypothetical protein